MDVCCEKCATEYELDETKLKSSGVTVKCTNCGHMFKVRKRTEKAEGQGGGSLRTWLVRMTDGEIKACYELSTLQQWIAAGHVTRECQISRTGKKWKQLGEIAELSSFFDIAEDAKREAAVRRQATAADAGKRGVAHPHTLKREVSQNKPLPKPVTGSHGVGLDPKRTVMGQPALVPPRPLTEKISEESVNAADETVPVSVEIPAQAKAPTRPETEEGPTQSFDGPRIRAESESDEGVTEDDGPTRQFAPDGDGPTQKFAPDARPSSGLAALSATGGGFEEDAPTKTFSPDSAEYQTHKPKKTAIGKKVSTPPSSASGEIGAEPAASAKKKKKSSDSDGPSFANIGSSSAARDGDAAFVGGSLNIAAAADDEYDDGEYRSSGGGAGKWIAVGSVVVMAAAGVILYFTVFAGDKGGKKLAGATIDGGGPAVTSVEDAADQPDTPDNDPGKVDEIGEAAQAVLLDSPAALELAKESLAKREGAKTTRSVVTEARVLLALAQHSSDRPAASKRESQARIREVRKLTADAATLAKNARAEDAASVPAMIVTADVLRLQGRPTREVERFLRKVITADKDNRDALYVRALLRIRDKRHQEARAILKELVDDSVPDTRPRYRLSVLDFGDQQFDAAKSGVEAVLQLAKEHSGAQELLLRIEKAQAVATTDSMPPQTNNDNGKTGGTGPGPVATGDTYATLIKKANKTAEVGNCASAIGLYRKALDKNPSGVGALTGLGYCHTDRREFAQAQGKFRAALGISPRSQSALYGVAEAYQQQGLKAKAIASYKKYLAAHPSAGRSASARKQIEKLGGSVGGGTGDGKTGDGTGTGDGKTGDGTGTGDGKTGDGTGTGDGKTGDGKTGGDPPPTDKPPADKPPADKPPADKPPADKPPADKPPADKPPADPSPAGP